MKKIKLLSLLFLFCANYAYSEVIFRDIPYNVQLELLSKAQDVAQVYAKYLKSVIDTVKIEIIGPQMGIPLENLILSRGSVRKILKNNARILSYELLAHESGKWLEKKTLIELEFIYYRLKFIDKLIYGQHAFGNETFYEYLGQEIADINFMYYQRELFVNFHLASLQRHNCFVEIYYQGQEDLFEVNAKEYCEN